MARTTKTPAPVATNVEVGGNPVVIGCKLPHGLILDHPLDPSKKVEINGLNRSLIIGATYATTQVDAEFWEHWKTVHKDFPALKSGAIFEAGTAAEAAAVAKELEGEKTGFEPMAQDGTDERAAGVKSVDKD